MSELATQSDDSWAGEVLAEVSGPRVLELIAGWADGDPTEDFDYDEPGVGIEVFAEPISEVDSDPPELTGTKKPPVEAPETVNLDPLTQFRMYADRFPLLEHSDEIRLGRAIQEGDSVTADQARETMINHNLRLVISIARKYQGREIELIDLIHEGVTGLITAVDRFDYRRGKKFSTYATWWIRQAVRISVVDKSKAIRVPKHQYERLSLINAKRRSLKLELDREPTDKEVATAAGLTLRQYLDTVGAFDDQPVSLNKPMKNGHMQKDGAAELGEIIEDPFTLTTDEIDRRIIRRQALGLLLAKLPDREVQILVQRHGLDGELPRTQKEVAANIGVDRSLIGQIENESLEKLRALGAGHGLEDVLLNI
ncbi:MAG TPA: sigma-70 family RNA polymerase sigma factor [Candidatus Babeliales bacterium]|nr:sigma-70 family RNA polymerase sigma factor [Candidatus Babeliales bacterium]